jgi:large subunit ribosomal protein L29
MKAKELRQKSSEELNQELTELSEELFKLKMQKGLGQVAKPHNFKKVRHEIARIKTIVNEKERERHE